MQPCSSHFVSTTDDIKYLTKHTDFEEGDVKEWFHEFVKIWLKIRKIHHQYRCCCLCCLRSNTMFTLYTLAVITFRKWMSNQLILIMPTNISSIATSSLCLTEFKNLLTPSPRNWLCLDIKVLRQMIHLGICPLTL